MSPRRWRASRALSLCGAWASFFLEGGRASAYGAEDEPGEELCVVVQRTEGGASSSGQLLRAIRQTWAIDNNTFFVRPGRPHAEWPDGALLPPGIGVWRSFAQRMPRRCGWLLKVAEEAYVNVGNLATRLRCFAAEPRLSYLGVPKIVASGAGDEGLVILVADAEAGVVLRRSLLVKLGLLLEHCVHDANIRRAFFLTGYEDIALGACLWVHGVEMHSWLDPKDEVYYALAPNVLPYMGVQQHQTPFQRVMDAHVESSSLAGLQCVFIVAGLSAAEVVLLHAYVGKSQRWFKNIACVAGGFSFPELTSASSSVNGARMREPIFAPLVRHSLQQCFLADAFHALQKTRPPAASALAAPAGAPAVDSPEALAREWRDPLPADGPAMERLRRGGHEVCVFVVGTASTEQHLQDADAVLRSWGASRKVAEHSEASPPGGGVTEGVEVFLVDRQLPGPTDTVLRLRGDVDLGFIYNSVRVLYLWRYLALHHAGDCAWFVKADADTFINTFALRQRLLRYFDAEKPHYLGAAKVTRLGSGRELRFAYNLAILSRQLLREAADWLEVCVDDLAKRKLGKGAEDIELAYCLDLHGAVKLGPVGANEEVMSRGMLRAAQERGRESNVSMGRLLSESGACTLYVHPVHAEEMEAMHSEVVEFRRAAVAGAVPDVAEPTPAAALCDWPTKQRSDASRWERYMKQTYWSTVDCWMGEFTWQACCDVAIWGPGGHATCWDEEYTFDRCCSSPSIAGSDEAQ